VAEESGHRLADVRQREDVSRRTEVRPVDRGAGKELFASRGEHGRPRGGVVDEGAVGHIFRGVRDDIGPVQDILIVWSAHGQRLGHRG